jgi:diaminopimelate decarboxylase
MDSIDRNILVALQHDGAAGLAELAKVAGLSVSATAERVKRLEERGTIRGWRADLDPAAVGCPLLAFVFVALRAGAAEQKFREALLPLEPVLECHAVSGGWNYLVKLRVAMLFTDLKEAGVKLRMVNLGGGYPVPYRQEVPGIDDFGAAIMGAMTKHFGNDLPEMVIEPGRFLVGDAGVVSSEVVLVSRKGKDDPVRWVYLDIGRFGGLAETEGEAIRYASRTPHDGGADGPVTIAGPTCDSADTLYEKSHYRLPMALQDGDRVELLATGAYVTTYASQGFNGFRPLAEHYI